MSNKEGIQVLVAISVMSLGWIFTVRQEKEKSWYLQLTVTRMQNRIELIEEYIQENGLPTPAVR